MNSQSKGFSLRNTFTAIAAVVALVSSSSAREDVPAGRSPLREDRRSHELAQPQGEDPSCSRLDRALQRGYNSGRYSVQEWEVWPDGRTTLAFEQRSNGRFMYLLNTVMGWSIRQRWEMYTVEDGQPVFTNCTEVAAATTYRGDTAIYTDAEWQRGSLRAVATVVLSEQEGRILRVDRRFVGHSPFRTERTFEIWETRRDLIAKPDAKPDLPW
ncbi:hypothetical protein [Rhizobium sp. Rhizsp82]|uniref:hypothetical protein n=1 Tax=Rhizobium sp. Rhizsp82 TaxID=3243057 RepID=UPI0039B3E918